MAGVRANMCYWTEHAYRSALAELESTDQDEDLLVMQVRPRCTSKPCSSAHVTLPLL